MKKGVIILAFALFGVFTAQAQIWIGCAVNASFNKEIKTFSIAPDVGYCIPSTPFSIACAVEYGGAFQPDKTHTHSLSVSPYFRYDICEIGELFSLFVDLISNIDVLEFGLLDVGLCPGVSFDITDHWSTEFSIGFLGFNREQAEDKSTKHSFELELKLAAPSFGIYYNF